MANKVRLGDLLVRDGLITEANLRTMLAQQKQHGGRLGEHLIRVNLCTETDIAQALARQLGIPFNDLSDPPAPAVAKIIPRDVAVKVQALAGGKNPLAARLGGAFAHPPHNKALLEVEKAISPHVAPQSAPPPELPPAIEAAPSSP